MQGNYFYISHCLNIDNTGILVSFRIKLEIKDNLCCCCLSVKDIIFVRQIPWTILAVQITLGSMQRMKINFSFPKGVSTHGHIKLKGLKKKKYFERYFEIPHAYMQLCMRVTDTTLIGPQDLALK